VGIPERSKQKGVLDGSGKGKVVLHSGKNRKRLGTGTHPLVASSSCWKVWEVVVSLQRSKKCRASKSYPQATRAFKD